MILITGLKAAAAAALLMCGMSTTGMAAADSALDAVTARGTLVGGVAPDYPPFGYTDKDGHIVGFDVDVLSYLASKLGTKLDIRPVSTSNRIPFLMSGTVDIIASSFTITRDRQKVVDFTIPYMTMGGKFLVKKDSGIHGWGDLADKVVSFTQGTPFPAEVQKYQPKAKTLVFQDTPQGILAVVNGKADAFLDDAAPLFEYAKDHPTVEAVGEANKPTPMGLAVRPDDKKWRDFVNFALMDMWKDGSYAAAYKKAFGVDPKEGEPGFQIPAYPWYGE